MDLQNKVMRSTQGFVYPVFVFYWLGREQNSLALHYRSIWYNSSRSHPIYLLCTGITRRFTENCSEKSTKVTAKKTTHYQPPIPLIMKRTRRMIRRKLLDLKSCDQLPDISISIKLSPPLWYFLSISVSLSLCNSVVWYSLSLLCFEKEEINR